MDKVNGNVVLITGASSGIGKATAQILSKEGFRVYGTSRKINNEEIEKNTEESGMPERFPKMIQLDVCSEESVKKAVDFVEEQEGRIDILINNAGSGIAGSVEDTSEGEAFNQMNTNFFGVHRMCRNVLPIMRRQKKGLIINIGSVAGLFSIPFQSMYSASKFALEALSEAMRIEVKAYGIKVILVEPGDTKTGFTDSRRFVSTVKDSVYEERFKKAVSAMIKDEMSGPGPEVVAMAVKKAVGMKNPPVRVVVGLQYKIFIFLKRFLPSRFVEFILARMY